MTEHNFYLLKNLSKRQRKRKSQNNEGEDGVWNAKFSWDDEVDRVNKLVFCNQSFREKQREVINATKCKRDVVALIPTGGGKSLTFQLPAVTEKGVTIVCMPLLSLINDQITQMKELGVE